MIRLVELSLASRLSASGTRFSLVFHTEGLVNPKIVQRLETFGRGLENAFRPLLAVTTPLCPQYMVDPLVDRARIDFAHQGLRASSESDFEKSLKSLAAYYDIGYHGHFFSKVNGRYRPAFDDMAISKQFEEECRYLSNLGFGPYCYAGGWWFISPKIVSLLQECGFSIDTTMNDVHLDSFSRPQHYSDHEIGRPYWLADEVLEVPSVRSLGGLWNIMTKQRSSAKFAVLSLHDYDLVSSQKVLDGLLKKLFKADRLLSLPQLIEGSKDLLSTSRGRN